MCFFGALLQRDGIWAETWMVRVTGIQVSGVRAFQAEQTAITETQGRMRLAHLRDRKLGSMAEAAWTLGRVTREVGRGRVMDDPVGLEKSLDFNLGAAETVEGL